MPELRKDPVSGRWVIISTERAKRPEDFQLPEEKKGSKDSCPFCEGHEDKTPPEVFCFRKSGTKADSPGWSVRVVPNKFPALTREGALSRRGSGIYDLMNGVGAHEVVIETPDHRKNMTDFSPKKMGQVISAYRGRIIDLKKDPRLKYILIFRNYGREAGTSLAHPHSQLVATPITPKRVKEELIGAKDYYLRKERCVFCDIIRQETESKERLIMGNKNFLAFAPFAARFPFESWIIPKRHSPDFETIKESEKDDLASILQATLKKISRALGNPPYNYILHTGPNRLNIPGYWQTLDFDYHWHIEIMPRVVRIAGFEWGSGFYINPMPPEEAAKFLRKLTV